MNNRFGNLYDILRIKIISTNFACIKNISGINPKLEKYFSPTYIVSKKVMLSNCWFNSSLSSLHLITKDNFHSFSILLLISFLTIKKEIFLMLNVDI